NPTSVNDIRSRLRAHPIPLAFCNGQPLHLTSSRRRLQHHPLPPSSRPIRPPQPSRTLLSISGADLNDAVQATAPAQRISTFPYHHRTAPPPDQRLASFASAKPTWIVVSQYLI
ncbi:hypothetical protein ACCO45_008826, partial [Purpureocillium lilacinum]